MTIATRTDGARSSDYPLSLQLSASALWGDNFWGHDNLRRRETTPARPVKRGAGHA